MSETESSRSGRVIKRRRADSPAKDGGAPPSKRARNTPSLSKERRSSTPSNRLPTKSENAFFLWTANDDLLLKEAMQNIGDYSKIARSVKFSNKYSREEVEARWHAMLYDPSLSNTIADRMAELPSLNKRVLWNEWEEDILRYEVLVKNQFQFQHILETYRSQFHSSRTAKSLEAHYYRMKRSNNLGMPDPPVPPHICPTPTEINPRTKEMEEYCKRFLPDEPRGMPVKQPLTAEASEPEGNKPVAEPQPIPRGRLGLTESTATAADLLSSLDAVAKTEPHPLETESERQEREERETALAEEKDLIRAKSHEKLQQRNHSLRARDVEIAGANGVSMASLDLEYDELPKDEETLKAHKAAYKKKSEVKLVEIVELEKAVARQKQAEMGDALALLHGSNLRYLMMTEKVVLGRNTEHNKVDVDLAIEGRAAKVSRRHAKISLVQGSSKFRVENIGTRTIFVDGQPLAKGKKCRLPDNALLDISNIKLIFEVNRARFAVKVAAPDDASAPIGGDVDVTMAT